MTDAELMAQIRLHFGDYIDGACEGTSIAPAFVAALVANESGGNATATRFEPAVFASLARVTAGQLSAYEPAGIRQPIGADDLKEYCAPARQLAANGPVQPVNSFAQSLVAMINLATSWGPTQIMGWHALEMGFPLGDLTNLAVHFDRTVQLLEAFFVKYPELNNQALSEIYFGRIFRCWNGGSPTAKTFDPNYIANGLNRMALYAAISAAAN